MHTMILSLTKKKDIKEEMTKLGILKRMILKMRMKIAMIARKS
jgi:hypothetical protein